MSTGWAGWTRTVGNRWGSGFVLFFCFVFFNDTPSTEIYSLSLPDARPILDGRWEVAPRPSPALERFLAMLPNESGPRSHRGGQWIDRVKDRKSTRPNSSHTTTSYAVVCSKKKKKKIAHCS